jgi:hypothetical protein
VDEQRARLDLVLRGRTVDGHPYRERRTGFGKAHRSAHPASRRVVRLLRARPDPSAGVRAPRWYRAPMVRHVVCFRWNEGTTPGQVGEVAAALRELPGLIPEIRSFKCGPDVGVNAGDWDFAVVAEFDSIDDQTSYRDHPEHQRVITDLVAPIRADRAAVQYDAG